MACDTPVAPGDRIEVVSCGDRYTPLAPGTVGTVVFVDDTGTVFAEWEGGSRLGLLPQVDSYRRLPPTAAAD